MLSKKVQSYIKLQVLSGMANPSPPVGPALGQRGLNIMKFCNEFNERTRSLEKGIPTPVLITVFFDKTFIFVIKTPPVSVLLKRKLLLKRGSDKPKHNVVGYITKTQLIEIAKIKLVDVFCDLKSTISCVEGTARSMGILIKK